MIGFSIIALIFGCIYPLTHEPALLMAVGFFLVASINVLLAIGFALYVPEQFPTEVRMRGTGFCHTIGRMMTILTPQLVVPLFATRGIAGVIGLVGALLFIQAALIAIFGIETRVKSLEELNPTRSNAKVGALEPGQSNAVLMR